MKALKKVKYRAGVNTDLKILLACALKKEQAQYDTPKAINKDYHTVLRHLKALQHDGLICFTQTQEAKKHGKEKKFYTVTLRGLANLLAVEEKAWNNINEIAKNHTDKLLVFEKWDFFAKENLQHLIIGNLKHALLSLQEQTLMLATFGFPIVWKNEVLRLAVDSQSLGCYYLTGSKQLQDSEVFKPYLTILKVCKKDSELTKFVEDQLKSYEQNAKEQLGSLEKAKKIWISL